MRRPHGGKWKIVNPNCKNCDYKLYFRPPTSQYLGRWIHIESKRTKCKGQDTVAEPRTKKEYKN